MTILLITFAHFGRDRWNSVWLICFRLRKLFHIHERAETLYDHKLWIAQRNKRLSSLNRNERMNAKCVTIYDYMYSSMTNFVYISYNRALESCTRTFATSDCNSTKSCFVFLLDSFPSLTFFIAVKNRFAKLLAVVVSKR